MKIHEILVETEDYDDRSIAEMLQRDCAPFLAAIKNNIHVHKMWRGMNIPETNIARFTTRTDRPPVDTPKVVSNAIDDYFEATTGTRWRSSSVFVSGNQAVAADYGTPFCMFPIGQFHYCWSSRVNDLYNTLDRQLDRYHLRYHHFSDYPSPEAEEKNKLAFSTLNKILPELDYRVDIDLTEAIAMGQEIMVSCDKYYMVGSEIIDAVADIIQHPIR